MDRSQAGKKVCPTCGKEIPYEKRRNKFCSTSCANKGVVRVKTVNSEFCAYCGKKKEKRHNKYCDTCHSQNVYNRVEDVASAKSPDGVRAYLLRTRDHRCEMCQLKLWNGIPITLEVHHIDGNSDNNEEDNLQLLCPNCHSQTDNFKGAAKGGSARYSNRRKKRRTRYQNGETW